MEVKELYEWARNNKDKHIEDTEDLESIKETYIQIVNEQIKHMKTQEFLPLLISRMNYRDRHKYLNSHEIGVIVRPGDVCFIDFGEAYIQEIGYQHFALVMSNHRGKILVVPMTGNEKTYNELLADKEDQRRTHLWPFKKIPGLNKNSILFLNDAKYVNSARVIDVKAHLSTSSYEFMQIQKRLHDIIFLK